MPPPALEAKFAAFAGDEAAAADTGLGFPEFLMLTNALIRPSTEALGTTPEPRESGEMAGSGFVFPIGLLFDFNLVEISTFIPSTQPSDLHCAPPSPLPPVKPSLGTSKPSFYLRASSAAVCPLPSRQCTCRRPHAAVLGHIFLLARG